MTVTDSGAAVRLDAVNPTPLDIQRKKFREAFRGYNQEEVDDFLDELAEEIARLTQEGQRLRVQVAALQQEVARVREGAPAGPAFEPESNEEAREEAKRALAAAQSAAEALLQEARAKADEVIAEAEARAADVRANADASASVVAAPAHVPTGDADADEVIARVQELERQETDVRTRLRELLEEELRVLDRIEAQSHQKATVQRMSRELGDGGDEPEPNPRRFWREPNS